MNLGVDDFITKPIDYNELLNSVRARLDKLERLQHNNDNKFYALINNPLTGVFIYSKNKFDYVNETCAKIFGMQPSDFSNMSFNSIITGCDKRVVLKKIEDCVSKSQNAIHACFQASHYKEKHSVIIEMYAGYVNFRGTDSLVGYMTEMC
jgi:YesN/AraC family two-component response regulator